MDRIAFGEKVFDVVTAEEWRVRLNAGIGAPVVSVRPSVLGGPDRISLMLMVALDERSSWPNGILENSRYFRIRLDNDGVMEMFSGWVGKAKALRKTRVRSADEAVAKLNQYIAYVDSVKVAKTASDLRSKVEDKEAELNARLAEASRHVFRALAVDAAESQVEAAMKELEALERAVNAVEDSLL